MAMSGGWRRLEKVPPARPESLVPGWKMVTASRSSRGFQLQIRKDALVPGASLSSLAHNRPVPPFASTPSKRWPGIHLSRPKRGRFRQSHSGFVGPDFLRSLKWSLGVRRGWNRGPVRGQRSSRRQSRTPSPSTSDAPSATWEDAVLRAGSG